MKNNVFIFTLLFISLLNAQVYSSFKNLPLERVYVHKNATLLFVGEYLYYKVYSVEVDKNKPSKASKIAYVELIGKDKKAVFKHKIKLENSVGYGDFFIPTTVPSGNYKLVAYTQWMQNNTSFQFFESELNIINPYLGNQKDVVVKENPILNTSEINKEILNRRFQINTDKKIYGKREKVTLEFTNTKEEYGFGNYSISVRKIDTINTVKNYSAINFYSDNVNKKIIRKILPRPFIPEEKGELVSGNILDKNSKLPASNVSVTVSIPEKSFFLKNVKTNKSGDFNFYLNEEYDGDVALIQVIGKDRNKYNLSIDKNIEIDKSKLAFNEFHFNSSIKDFIINRSINNQIENSYYSVKPDSIQAIIQKPYFYNDENSVSYILDEYKNFPTLNETFIEVIDPVYKKRMEGEVSFYIKHRKDFVNDGAAPLVLMDGIMVQDYDELLAYKSSKVKKITIQPNRVYFGAETYAGVIAIETKEGNFKDEMNKKDVTSLKLFKPLSIKKYFKQEYTEENKEFYSRIPDYRNQLLWEPSVKLSSNKIKISFYTSDLSGDFEIVLEGFSNIGEAVSLKKIFTVK